MNGKAARAMRREAEKQSVGQSKREYRVINQSKQRQRFDPVTGLTNTITPPGTLALTKACTRGWYQHLKRCVNHDR